MLPAVLFLGSLLTLLMLLLVVRRIDSPGATPFFGLLAGSTLYSFGYALELMTPPGLMSLFWTQFQYWGIVSIPSFWLWMSLETPQQIKLRSPWLYTVLFALPVTSLSLLLTNDYHHLFFARLDYQRVGDLTLALTVKGPAYYVHLAYCGVVFVLSPVFFLFRWRKLGHGYGDMAIRLLLGSLFAWAGLAVYLLGYSPQGLDTTPLGLTLSAAVYYRVLRPARLFEMVPLSRELVFRLISTPVLVVDRRFRLVDWNPAFEQLWPAFATAHVGARLGRLITDPVWVQKLTDPHFHKATRLSLDREGSHWQVEPTAVTDDGGKIQGRVFLFHDSTKEVSKDLLLERLDLTDPVTGLFHLQAFETKAVELLAVSLRQQQGSSLVLLELFVDDEARLRAAAALGEGLIRGPHLFGRLSPSRFGLLLPGSSAGQAVSQAESLASQWASRGNRASFGVATLASTSTSAAPWLDLSARCQAALEVALEGRGPVAGCLAEEDGTVGTCLEDEKGVS